MRIEYHFCKRQKYHILLLQNISLCHGTISLENLVVFIYTLLEVSCVSKSILRDKAKEFAKEVVFVCKDIKAEHKETVLTNQLLRCATSIGANLHEAQYAQGKKDFISKLEIAQKECFETEYWVELLFETQYMSEQQYNQLQNSCGTIRRMLISSITTTKENMNK